MTLRPWGFPLPHGWHQAHRLREENHPWKSRNGWPFDIICGNPLKNDNFRQLSWRYLAKVIYGKMNIILHIRHCSIIIASNRMVAIFFAAIQSIFQNDPYSINCTLPVGFQYGHSSLCQPSKIQLNEKSTVQRPCNWTWRYFAPHILLITCWY